MKRTVLVTGASSGIGNAVAERLLSETHAVIGVSRNIGDAAFENRNFHAIRADLADLESLPDRVAEILERFPDIDSAVFCAGAGRFGSVEEFSLDQIRYLMDLNFTSQAFIARCLIPRFKRRQSGDLIFIGSEAALSGSRMGSIYCASKFALRGFTQALRQECGKCGIRVTLINPGMVRTAFFDELGFRPGDSPHNAIEVADIAESVCWIFNLRPGTVLDEINLSPLTKVMRFTP
ncbi:MAG: SDR family oxidoreductase [Gammaproteobacteria bacterium]